MFPQFTGHCPELLSSPPLLSTGVNVAFLRIGGGVLQSWARGAIIGIGTTLVVWLEVSSILRAGL